MHKVVAMLAAVVLGMGTAGCSGGRDEMITQAELVRRSQELLDGVTAGNRAAFERYFASDSLIHDEKGRTMDKTALLADITAPPPDWSGAIAIKHPQSRIVGSAAILSYDVEETETISGQTVHARYHTTDTWLRRNGAWQIAAEQVLRYYEDPAQGQPDTARYADYQGVYELAPGKTMEVSSAGEALFSQRSGRSQEQLFPETGDLFFRRGIEGRRLFRRDARGKVDALIDRRNNEDIVWRKVR